jgi:hypothetical protein
MPLLFTAPKLNEGGTELGWFFSLRGYKDAAPPGPLRLAFHPAGAGC